MHLIDENDLLNTGRRRRRRRRCVVPCVIGARARVIYGFRAPRRVRARGFPDCGVDSHARHNDRDTRSGTITTAYVRA